MLLDMNTLLSDKQAITGSAASDNTIDFGPASTPPRGAQPLKQDFGGGNNMPLLIQVTEAFNNLTSISITVQVDDNEAFASPTVAANSGTIAAARLVPGFKLAPFNVPIGADQRYMRLQYTVNGTAPTTGRITAGITTGIQTGG